MWAETAAEFTVYKKRRVIRPRPVFRMENTLVLQLLTVPGVSLAMYRDAAATSTTIGHCNDGLLCLRNVRRSEVNGTRCPLSHRRPCRPPSIVVTHGCTYRI